ncbi:purine-cytosine permease family protein [Streptomyces boluensis]|uniref:Cytosine permease n=1 Tax=Streptomyces boluensis TaxID=1775135 RepID=A0A964XK88_9ACTN|nr:cytosine permease [Streptomyces boluensis]NBE50288.1 cytosine permease [Streptomyces boluensis]
MDSRHPVADDAAHASAELDSEYEHSPVPPERRKSLLTVSAVWFGFPMILTNAVPGGVVVAVLGFWRGLAAILVANLVMFVYVGLLSHRAGSTGESFALQATKTFGRIGYVVASGFLATIVVGWFAFNTGATGATLHQAFGWHEQLVAVIAGAAFVAITYLGIRALSWLGAVAAPLFIVVGVIAIVLVAKDHDLGAVLDYQGVAPAGGAMTFGAAVSLIMATFADSGTMTADFTRWSKDGKQAVLATATAFPLASLVAQITGGIVVAAGAIASAATVGGNFLPILTGHSIFLDALAAVFVFVNLGSVCSHCLYNGALSWSHLTRSKMRIMTLILGVIGTAAALAGVWNHFLDWLVILSVFVPPLGGVLIADQVILRRHVDARPASAVRPTAFIAWGAGALVGGLVHWYAPQFSDAVSGLVVALLVHVALERLAPRPSAAA